jgi:hypothetical protein
MPKPMEKHFFVGFGLTSVGQRPIEISGRKLDNFHQLYVANKKMLGSCNFHQPTPCRWKLL